MSDEPFGARTRIFWLISYIAFSFNYRYLWPLIHYHKFLARCIKKLKRNGVDVKTSVSPVSVFLREEVCAVSDHLASVSMFDSEEWMHCLEFFNGWVASDEESEARIRELVSTLNLRPMMEPGDVDSPLLRSQIDEQYLRAMTSARAHMAGNATSEERQPRPGKVHTIGKNRKNRDEAKINPPHPKVLHSAGRQPPVYPREPNGISSRPPARLIGSSPPVGLNRQHWGYPPEHCQWWGNNWGPGGFLPDDGSVRTGPAGDNLPHQFDLTHYDGLMQQAPYYPQMMFPQHPIGSGQPQAPFDPTIHDQQSIYGFSAPEHWGHPQMGNIPTTENPIPGTPAAPIRTHDNQIVNSQMDPNLGSPTAQMNVEQTPFKYNGHQVPMSPYWGHLDHATLAMMGIASPQGATSPQTPARSYRNADDMSSQQAESSAYTMNAQPLLLRQPYYGYAGYGAREGYAPPSPATQFMMSPQANFAYSYGYGTSPRNLATHSKRSGASPQAGEQNIASLTRQNSADSMTPTKGDLNKNGASPVSGGTTAEA